MVYKKEYFISFIEEGIFNPKYEDYAAGRIEVYQEGEQWAVEEIRFFTKRSKKWLDFREKWDFKDITGVKLAEIRKIVSENFYEIPKGSEEEN